MNECRYSESKSSTRPLKNAPVLSIAAGTRHYTLLNSNEPPECSEIPPIRSLISDADARLARIDDEISKIRETLKQLEEERSSLLNYRARNEGIISPVRRMPPEVLGEIFWWTLPSISEAQDKSEIADSPWTLTYVSSRWRAVSLSNPSLWSQIVIDYDDTKLPHPLLLIEARIQRAYRQSLKIHYSGSEGFAPGPQIQMFQLLLQHSSRWEELSLTLTSQIVPLLTELRGRLSSLKRLWLDWDGLEGQTDSEPLDCFLTAPSLVDVGISSEYRFVPVALPTHQLSRYHIEAPWDWHKNALKLATNLVEAHISAEFDDNQWPDADEIIILRHLRRLFVSNPRFLNYIVAPALEELAFSLAKDDTANDLLPHLKSFHSRSACPWRRLCVQIFPHADIIAQILGRFSCITELVISNSHVGPTARKNIDALLETLTVSALCERFPHLRLVVLDSAADKLEECARTIPAYLKMVKSRWQAENCALTTAGLIIEPDCKLDAAAVCSLHTLRQDGLDFLLINSHAALNTWLHCTSWMF